MGSMTHYRMITVFPSPRHRDRLKALKDVAPLLFDRQTGLLICAPSAIERDHVGVSHLLQRVGGESGPEPSTAIENQPRVLIRYLGFDILLSDALSQWHRTGAAAG